jgi:predicted dithiol-disulfide oxidoreductase (DUF899 family)
MSKKTTKAKTTKTGAKKKRPTHKVASREQWLAARKKLLVAEKTHTRRGDELARLRQELPWVRVEKDYVFDTDGGKASLADLFRGNSQLLIYHFMFGPDYKAGCPSCSSIADGFNGIAIHLANHDVTLGAVSRAPLAKLRAFKKRMGWSFPWASSFKSDFNADFGVGLTEEQRKSGKAMYNFGPRDVAASERAGEGNAALTGIAASTGTDWPTYIRELPGMSAFVLEDGVVYHTYSAYSRGLDGLWGMYQWLDRAPRGRNEEEAGIWWRRHDEYGSQSKSGDSCCHPAEARA